MVNIERTIDFILTKRELKQKNIDLLSETISKLKENLLDFKLLKENLEKKVDADFGDINFDKVLSNSDVLYNEASKMKKRFSRKRINIAVIGQARQGKSRLLQSISGLSGVEIPSGDSQHCTGVKSVIENSSNKETEATVSFYERDVFFKEIILPYYTTLKLDEPYSLEDFGTEELEPSRDDFNATQKELYRHLKNYHKKYSQYKDLLSTSDINIQRKDIRKYVAQDNAKGERIYSNYLVVKSLEIYAKFPQSHLGKISLIDLPGMGDTKLGDDTRILNEVKDNIDLVFFVKKPSSRGDSITEADVRLYDIVRDGLDNIPIALSSYMILNNDKKDNNQKNCIEIQDELKDHYSYKVSKALIVDSTNKNEVNNMLLESLEDLSRNIEKIDNDIVLSLEKQIELIKPQYTKLFQKLNSKFVSNANIMLEDHREFKKLFSDFYDKLVELLDSRKNTLKKSFNQDGENSRLNKIFEHAINNIFKSIEDDKDNYRQYIHNVIDTTAKKKNSLEAGKAEAMNIMRNNLAKRFFCLDDELEKMMYIMREDVINIFEDDEVKLHKLVDKDETILDGLIRLMDDEKHKGIKESLKNFTYFKLSYRGIMHNKIRKILNKLDPMLIPREDQDFGTDSKKIASFLIDGIYDEVAYESHQSLKQFITQPHLSMFTVTEELVDGVLYSHNSYNEWEDLMKENQEVMWKEEFEELAKKNKMIIKWNNKLDDMKDLLNILAI